MVIFTDKGDFASAIGDTSSRPDAGGYQVFGQQSFVGKSGKLFIGTFAMPQGIFVDRNDNIFIVDQLSHLYQQFKFLDSPARQKIMAENQGLIERLLLKEKQTAKKVAGK